MPFTVSHIAAVLPGYRPLTRANVFTAAVIGSMAPDFGVLVPGVMARWQTHSLTALFTFCLPVGLAVYWLTLLLIRPAVLEVMPDAAYVRLRASHPPASIRQPGAWLYAAAALLLGAVTHLVWDAFTHEDARGVRMFPLLTDYGLEISGHPVRLYRWLQYGSSVIGLAAVGIAMVLWLRHAPAPLEPPTRRIAGAERVAWRGAYLLLPSLAMSWWVWRAWSAGLSVTNGGALEWVAIAGMQGAATSLLLISVLIRIRLAA